MDLNHKMSGIIDRKLLEGQVFMNADELMKLKNVK